MAEGSCVFCSPDRARLFFEDEQVRMLWDAFAVSPGHALVVPRRHVATWFEATREEQLALTAAISTARDAIIAKHKPDGFNIGINVGAAAGQTVMHLHVHVIPRYSGDVPDPRGGVRHVIPARGNYLRSERRLATGGAKDPFSRHVLPLFESAEEVSIVAAFVQESGILRIHPALREALARGTRVRILTGDYLEITSAAGLEVLLDLERNTEIGSLSTRVIEVDKLEGSRVFHPKSWRFDSRQLGVAFVGSSNLSHSALESGIEWNLRIDRDRDGDAYQELCQAFESLWHQAHPLDDAWLAAYAARAQSATEARALSGEKAEEVLERPPRPHAVQLEALAKLRDTRADGFRRALVVLATGLGKTWLAAFDYWQAKEALGTTPRLLFLAHRDELLEQAALTFRRLFRNHGEVPKVAWCRGSDGDLSGDLVFGSIAKVSRKEQLQALSRERFDYVVLDEVHHAAADSYRRILDALNPGFLLGLTATPDRADARDIYGLFEDNVVYRADIGRGIAEDRLAPFKYFGVKDDIDYAHIPWRSRKFNPEQLGELAQTEARMQTLWRAWSAHAGRRSLVFCCSVPHALYVRTWLRERGVRVNAVFVGEGSNSREDSLRELAAGRLDAVCAVDLFNEGVDVPEIDRVVMLRPTNSNVLFLQQLGRGLRASETKDSVTVVDFVGNDKAFLERIRTLLSLGERTATSVRKFLESDDPPRLPDGCSVELELEAKEILARLYRVGGADEVERAYLELRDEQEQRPTAGQLQRSGYQLEPIRNRHGSWFEFVRGQGDLEPSQVAALAGAQDFLRELETTDMKRSFKMITLEALLETGSLFSGLPVAELAVRCHAVLRRSAELLSDVAEAERVDELTAKNERGWVSYWRGNPIEAWTSAKSNRRTWFKLEGERFVLAASFPPEHHDALVEMVRELVDYRLAQYRARRRLGSVTAQGFVCKVIWNQRDPILKLPNRSNGVIPEGETDVRLPDGSVWQFRMATQFCNVARPPGTQRNQLPDLLRRWFGPRAGQPGTAFEVRFVASPDGLWVEPVTTNVVALPRRSIVAYPDLRAAAGHTEVAQDAPDAEPIVLPLENDDPGLFAVRVSGNSMDGGDSPLRDGDWAVMRYVRGASVESVINRVVLVQVTGEAESNLFQIKRLRSRDGRWLLTSDNPDGPTFEATAETVPIARLEAIARPEDLAPNVGSELAELTGAFGIDVGATSGRHAGHLFIFIDRAGILEGPDRVRFMPDRVRPGETAFVLARGDSGTWRYLGVGRGANGTWTIPAVDYVTWKKWGAGREVSKSLPEGALSRAQQVSDVLLALPDAARWIEQPGGPRAKLVGAAPRGGLRLEGDFEPRSVTLTDIGWVVAADRDREANGGVLDEERVNRLRYLEGTPKGSTRWVDTKWALAAWAKAKPLLPPADDAPQLLIRDETRELDARFRLEPRPEGMTVVVEARGGTTGSKNEINTDYSRGLTLLLERFKAAGLRLVDAELDTRSVADLPRSERRLVLDGHPYPITILDAEELSTLLRRAQSRVGRAPGAKGSGNPTRRIRLYIDGELARDVSILRDALQTGERRGT